MLIIRTDLEYAEAMALINDFNVMEEKTQDRRNEEARQKMRN